MAELIRTADPALTSFVEALLSDAAIPYRIADRGVVNLQGVLPVILPRILVDDDRLEEARQILLEAELL